MFIMAIDLMGKFKPSPRGHQYALTVILIFTNCTWYAALYTKKTDDVVHAYLCFIYSKFDGSCKMLSDNVTDFKNNLFVHIFFTLGMKQEFSSPCYPQGSRHIENVYNVLNTYIQKPLSSKFAWDEVTHVACTVDNFVPN